MGRKAPAESAERMAKRAPHTVLENRRLFSSIGMVISPAEMHQSSGDDQDKSISGLLDNTTLSPCPRFCHEMINQLPLRCLLHPLASAIGRFGANVAEWLGEAGELAIGPSSARRELSGSPFRSGVGPQQARGQ